MAFDCRRLLLRWCSGSSIWLFVAFSDRLFKICSLNGSDKYFIFSSGFGTLLTFNCLYFSNLSNSLSIIWGGKLLLIKRLFISSISTILWASQEQILEERSKRHLIKPFLYFIDVRLFQFNMTPVNVGSWYVDVEIELPFSILIFTRDVPDHIDRSIDRSKSLDRLIDRSTSNRRSIITFKKQQRS